uniref:Geranylgeranylglyceryl phosphate synthase n=1 Tax=Cenarchaeum symbiosum (strain A) TaxID=414004 RepID=GGGPS_CENSY|nr:RecName: Full=Geranylgeranylglyceryl phosphate synthase; Short=GGGP synthase; Short=GGGPS; AltName: Full=(S)-3-O-geranylgeranylglyceryl phosphate synthase; AltName: Full=Phosphoglycerol geranylgeranyltransferase [Cenarchaeum symbiosum A]
MGAVEARLRSELKKRKTLLFALIDSEVSDTKSAQDLARGAEKAGASAILVGGSSTGDQAETSRIVGDIKEATTIPVILFPGNVTGVAPGADAILFSSLMNSENPYFITQAQALGAPSVLKFGLEALPTAYLVIGEGTSVWFVGAARGIPLGKPRIAAAYSLAARFLGMRFVYLEAGSGAESPVKPEMIRAVREAFDGFLIVGGGIRDEEAARRASEAGADAIVIGTMLEGGGSLDKLSRIAGAIGGT